MYLPTGEFDTKGIPQRIDDGMDFGCQPTAATTDCLGIVPPFALAAC